MRLAIRPTRRPAAVAPEPSDDEHANVPPGEAVTVEVVAARSTARQLSAACPPGWTVVPTDRASHHPCVDFVILVAPGPAAVRETRAHYPGADVVVLLARRADASEMAAVLDEGAAVCLRDAPAALVVGHLQACRRRRAHRRADHGRDEPERPVDQGDEGRSGRRPAPARRAPTRTQPARG